MLDKHNIIELGKKVASADKNVGVVFEYEDKKFTYDSLHETFRDELKALATDFNEFRRNKLTIFEIMQEVIDEVLPVRVYEAYGSWADIKQFPQGSKPSFKKKTGKQRAKQFITKVGLSGVYEVFKLDSTSYEIRTEAFGGAGQIGFEEFLDGTVDFADIVDIIVEGISDKIYIEIISAMQAIGSSLPAANNASGAGLVAASFDPLLSVVRAYGTPTIYAAQEFAAKLVPADGWISNNHMDEYNAQGFIGVYKGARVVILPNSFTDDSNATQAINPGFAFIMPSEKQDKNVKIAFEGETIIDDVTNVDRSREIQAYKKLGVAVIVTNDICVYEDTDLS